MSLWNSLRETLLLTLRHRRLWLVQFVGNLLLMLLFIWFLHFPDAYAWQVMISGLLLVVLGLGIIIVHGGTLNYCLEAERGKDFPLKRPFQNALKHVLPLLIVIAIIYFIRGLVDRMDDYQYAFPGYLRSEFPAWLRRSISEPAVRSFYGGLVTFLRWIVLPGLFLPLLLLCADRNFRGFLQFRAWLRMLLNLAWWIVLVVAWFLGVYCTAKLLEWKLDPRTASLHGEEIWLAFRMLLAYLLMLFSWLWTCVMLARARTKAEAVMQKPAA